MVLGDVYTFQDEPLESSAATRTVADVMRWFRKQQKRAHQRALTQQLRESGVDPTAVLEEKKRLQSEPYPPPNGLGSTV